LTTNGQRPILIAPLDWGLGHTTRCIPLIAHLRSKQRPVLFAGNSWQRAYISKTFAGIETIHLEGYNIRYSRSLLMLSLIGQIPQVLTAIRNEQEWIGELCAARAIGGIISDNRYGLYHREVPSVIMSHQLRIRTGLGYLGDELLRPLHYRFLNRFDECWIPDLEDPPGLGGKLSHPHRLPAHSHYLGLLSQLGARGRRPDDEGPLLVLLSGPEPQRTMLSDLLWDQLQHYRHPTIFVEGSAAAQSRQPVPAHVQHFLQLSRSELSPLLRQASLVICRSGYSTLMDLVALNKKAILIPTPGQTEQEYLARHLHRAGVFYAVRQKDLDLAGTLKAAADFRFRTFWQKHTAHTGFTAILDRWLHKVDAGNSQ